MAGYGELLEHLIDPPRRRVRPVVRKAQQTDLEGVCYLTQQFLATSRYGQLIRWIPQSARELAVTVIDKGTIFVAEVDGQLVGMVAGFAMAEPVGRTKILDEIAWFVLPAHRGGSVGVRLIEAFERWARQRELTLVKMIAPVDEPAVGRFLKRRGYVPVDTSYFLRL